MNTISSTQQRSQASTGNAQTASTKSAASESGTAAANAETNGSSNRAEVELSTRAQKIQKLNEEFFPEGPSSVKITPEFIQRLHQYDLISESDATQLSGALAESSSEPKPVKAIINFIDRFSEQLQEQGAEEGLIAMFDKAKIIINNLDGANQAERQSDIKSVMAELNSYRQSEAGQSLGEEDINDLQQLHTAMKIADHLNPSQISSARVSQYLSVLGQSF